MSAWLLVQYLVIAVVVVVSAWIVLRSQMPAVARRLRIALALPLLREGSPGWLKPLGRRIAPEAPRKGGDGACGGCDNCD